MLQKRLRMKALSRLSYFLGIEFEQGGDFVNMSQRRFLSKILERFEMSDLIASQGPHLLSSLVVKYLVFPEVIMKLLVAWFML